MGCFQETGSEHVSMIAELCRGSSFKAEDMNCICKSLCTLPFCAEVVPAHQTTGEYPCSSQLGTLPQIIS